MKCAATDTTVLFGFEFSNSPYEEVVSMFKNLLLSVILPVIVLPLSQSAHAADATAGRKLAEQWCAKCHNIENGAPFKLKPPSFAAISVYHAPDVILGKIIAPAMHSGMPDTAWLLQGLDYEDLVAYIASLTVKWADLLMNFWIHQSPRKFKGDIARS
jgi:cytochrome c553